VSNPFDSEDGTFTVLVNAAGQHSLWPNTMTVPAGWTVVFGPSDRAACLGHVSGTTGPISTDNAVRRPRLT
jgi:MbtH protein